MSNNMNNNTDLPSSANSGNVGNVNLVPNMNHPSDSAGPGARIDLGQLQPSIQGRNEDGDGTWYCRSAICSQLPGGKTLTSGMNCHRCGMRG